MSQSVTLPDDLVEQLRRVARKQGLGLEQLVAEWAQALVKTEDSCTHTANDDDLLAACTGALLEGSEPPVPADWNEIMGALQSSTPVYPTVEEAMSALRSRRWVKDV